MADMTLDDIAKKMADIDFAMLITRTEGGALAGRPMSNNGDVAFDGDTYFFAYQDTRTVADIGREPKVALSYAGAKGLMGKPGIFIAIEGTAELIREKSQFEAHWQPSLKIWFPDGVDTPGMVLIKVAATRLHYWDGHDEGELTSF